MPIGRYYNVGYQRPSGRNVDQNVDDDSRLDHDGTSLTLNWHLGDYTLTSISAYDYIRGRSTSDADYTPYEVNGTSYSDNAYRQYSQEIRLASPQQETLRWLAGAHYFHEDLDSNGSRIITPGTTPNGTGSNQTGGVTDVRNLNYTHKTDSYALFGNLTYDFTDNFSVTGGLRWTQEKKDIDLDLTQLTRATANGPLIPLAGTATNGNRQEDKTWEAWTYDLTPNTGSTTTSGCSCAMPTVSARWFQHWAVHEPVATDHGRSGTARRLRTRPQVRVVQPPAHGQRQRFLLRLLGYPGQPADRQQRRAHYRTDQRRQGQGQGC